MIRCRYCGFEMAMNFSMTWDEQIGSGCPMCHKRHEWWTGWPADGGPWAAGAWRSYFEKQRAHWLVASQMDGTT